MLESLITSKTRIKLLVKFFINSQTSSYLRNLETEFGESTNAIRLELNGFEEAGLLTSKLSGNKKYFKANIHHPFYNEIHKLSLKHVGIDTIVEKVVNKIGNIKKAFVTGDIAKGIQSKIIDLTLVGENVDYNYLNELVVKTEQLVSLKIRYIVITENEMTEYFNNNNSYVLVWSEN